MLPERRAARPLTEAEARALALRLYGLEAEALALPGEFDDNFRLASPDGRLHVVKARGGIPHAIRWTFQPHGNGTDFGTEVEYEIPGSLLGRLTAPFVRRLNEREAELTVHNLKERMEAVPPGTA